MDRVKLPIKKWKNIFVFLSIMNKIIGKKK